MESHENTKRNVYVVLKFIHTHLLLLPTAPKYFGTTDCFAQFPRALRDDVDRLFEFCRPLEIPIIKEKNKILQLLFI